MSNSTAEQAAPKLRGRPPGRTKTADLRLRTTDQRKAKLARLATAAGVSASAWVEQQIDRAREPS